MIELVITLGSKVTWSGTNLIVNTTRVASTLAPRPLKFVLPRPILMFWD